VIEQVTISLQQEDFAEKNELGHDPLNIFKQAVTKPLQKPLLNLPENPPLAADVEPSASTDQPGNPQQHYVETQPMELDGPAVKEQNIEQI
jgi:hypothetical protein